MRLFDIALATFVLAGSAALFPSSEASSSSSPFAFPAARADERPGYRRDVARLERRISVAERLVRAAPKSWLRRTELAELRMDRASLTGSFDDYRAAENLIEDAIALGPQAAAPRLLRAQLHFTLHRFDRVEADLDLPERAAESEVDESAIQAMRGSLAFERGDYAEAERLFVATLAVHESYDVLARLAHLHARTCRFDRAAELFAAAERALPDGAVRARAWLFLQRGLVALDRGRLDEALGWYGRADAIYPQWWLVEEHIAEIEALTGERESARRRYEAVVAETESPELMAALAGVVDDESRARSLVAEAKAIYEAELLRFPEATYGHALDLWLEMEDEVASTLAMAEKNHALRPNGESRTKLAQALVKAGRLEAARAELEQVLSTPHCSAETYALAASVAEKLGDRGAAARHAERALAINPRALDQN